MKTMLLPPARSGRRPRGMREKTKPAAPTLWELIKPYVGIADNPPSDFAANHDHYLHGSAKRDMR
jgi:hypothetical protein